MTMMEFENVFYVIKGGVVECVVSNERNTSAFTLYICFDMNELSVMS